jgi:Na+-driven multidrug efflux pump
MLFPAQTLELFTTDPEFLRTGVSALQVFAITFLTTSEVVISGFFQGLGKAKSAIIITSARHSYSRAGMRAAFLRVFTAMREAFLRLGACFPTCNLQGLMLRI